MSILKYGVMACLLACTDSNLAFVYVKSLSSFPFLNFMISNCSGLYLSRKVIGTPVVPLQYLSDDNSFIFSVASSFKLSVDNSGASVSVDVMLVSKDVKLFWVVSVEESNRRSDESVTISFCLSAACRYLYFFVFFCLSLSQFPPYTRPRVHEAAFLILY